MSQQNNPETTYTAHAEGHSLDRIINEGFLNTGNAEKDQANLRIIEQIFNTTNEAEAKHRFSQWMKQNNHGIERKGWQSIERCEDGSIVATHSHYERDDIIHKQQKIAFPEGLIYVDIIDHNPHCAPPAPPPPPAPAQQAHVAEQSTIIPTILQPEGVPTVREVAPGQAPGQGTQDYRNYDAAYLRLRLAKKLPPAEITPFGYNHENDTGEATFADNAKQVTNRVVGPAGYFAGLGAIMKGLGVASALGKSGISAVPLSMETMHSGANTMMERGGGKVDHNRDVFNVSDQFPIGTYHVLSYSDRQMANAVQLPYLNAVVDPKTGAMMANDSYTPYRPQYEMVDNGLLPQRISSDKFVKTGELNGHSWNKTSTPQLQPYDNFHQGFELNQDQLQMTLDTAEHTMRDASVSPEARQKAAQNALDAVNFTAQLSYVKALPLVAQAASDKKADFIALAAQQNITGLDTDHVPDTIYSAPRSEQQKVLLDFYNQTAERWPNAFKGPYQQVMQTNDIPDFSDKKAREAAMPAFVERVLDNAHVTEVPQPLPNLAEHVTTPVLNAFERGELRPQTLGQDNSSYKDAFDTISADPKAVQIILGDATTNRQLGYAILERDLLSINVTGHFGNHNAIGRDVARQELEARGYSKPVLDGLFDTKHPGRGMTWLPPELENQALQDITASANVPEIVQKRQADFQGLSTDGSKKDINFQPGDLAREMLHDFASQHDAAHGQEATTLLKLQDQLRASGGDASVEALRRGTEYGENEYTKKVLGVSRRALENFYEAQKGLLASSEVVSDAPIQNAPAAAPAANADAGVSQTLSAIAKSDEASTKLMQYIATSNHPDSKQSAEYLSGELLFNASHLPDAQRTQIANDLLNPDSFKAVTQAMQASHSVKLTPAVKDRFAKLQPELGKMSADDAQFALNAMSSDGAASIDAVINTLPKLPNDAKALVSNVLANNPEFGGRVLSALTPDQQASVAQAAGLAANALSAPAQAAPAQPAPVTNVPKHFGHHVIKANESAKAASSLLTSSDDSTRNAALNAAVDSARTNPEQAQFISGAIVQTLMDHPEYSASVAEALTKAGSQQKDYLMDKNAGKELGTILTGLANAKHANDTAAATTYANQLNAFMQASQTNTPQGAKDREALSALTSLVLTGHAADTTAKLSNSSAVRDALATTIATAMTSTSLGTPALPDLPQVTVDTAGLSHTIATAQPVSDTELGHNGALYDISGSFHVQILPYWKDKPHHFNPPTKPGKPDECVTPGQDICQVITPSVPVTPSVPTTPTIPTTPGAPPAPPPVAAAQR